MRITDKETNLELQNPEEQDSKSMNNRSDFSEKDDLPDAKHSNQEEADLDFNKKIKQPKHKNKASFSGFKLLKSCGCLLITFLVVVVMVLWLILSFFKPIVQQVDALPNDFPAIIKLYKPEIANITIQDKEDKIMAGQIINALPEWLISPLWSYLSPNLKTRILAENKESQPTISELKTTIDNELKKDKTKTVFASWDNISKDKKELFEYYKNQLLSTGFNITENIDDYDWNLIFSKNNISGAISVYDNLMSGGSVLNLVVSY